MVSRHSRVPLTTTNIDHGQHAQVHHAAQHVPQPLGQSVGEHGHGDVPAGAIRHRGTEKVNITISRIAMGSGHCEPVPST
jgi:hypothetical protein